MMIWSGVAERRRSHSILELFVAVLAAVGVSTSGLVIPMLPAAAAGSSTVLVFGDQDNGFEADNAASTLRSFGLAVDRLDRLPADLTQYQQIWYVEAYRGLDASEQTALAAYLNAGGAVYVTGERPCCEGLNATVQNVLRNILKDQNVQVGGLGDISGPFTFNFGAVEGIAAEPNTLVDFVPHSPGGMDGLLNVSSSNVFASSATIPVGAAWAETDMKAGKGRLALLMDIDWLGEDARAPIIENIQNFLSRGAVCDDTRHWDGFGWFGAATATETPRNCTTLLSPTRVTWKAATDAGPISIAAVAQAGATVSCSAGPTTVGTAETSCDIEATGNATGRFVVTATDSRGASVRHYGVRPKNDLRNVPAPWSISSTWWSWPDSDKDGIPNHWEENGVYVDGRFLDLPSQGANPQHKDLFIHIDYQDGEQLSQGVYDRMINTFAKSPLPNPDGKNGVTLHVQEGASIPRSIVGNYWELTTADIAKIITYSGFANAPESGGVGVPQIFKHFLNHGQAKGNGGGEYTIGKARVKGSYGWTALHSADEVLAMFGVAPLVNGDPADFMRASNLTHELGHMLGLLHHGTANDPEIDSEYLSVMTYAYNVTGVPSGLWGARRGIDYARAGDKVNEDWRLGKEKGAITFVPGQHGEIPEYYELSANETVLRLGDEPVEEAPVQEILGQTDPTAFGEFATEFGLEPTNHFPTAGDVSGSVVVGQELRLPLVGSDPEGTPVSFQLMTQPNGVSARIEGDALVLGTAGMDAGLLEFSYRAISDQLSSPRAKVSVTLLPAPAVIPAPGLPAVIPAPERPAASLAASSTVLGHVVVANPKKVKGKKNKTPVVTAKTKVTMTASVSPANATGTVSFSDSGHALGTAPVIGGQAVIIVSGVYGGQQSLVATYSGDGAFAGSTSAPVALRVKDTAKPKITKPRLSKSAAAPTGTFRATDAGGVKNVLVRSRSSAAGKKKLGKWSSVTLLAGSTRSWTAQALTAKTKFCLSVQAKDYAGKSSRWRTSCTYVK